VTYGSRWKWIEAWFAGSLEENDLQEVGIVSVSWESDERAGVLSDGEDGRYCDV
jgi:hypothetical protein